LQFADADTIARVITFDIVVLLPLFQTFLWNGVYGIMQSVWVTVVLYWIEASAIPRRDNVL